MNPSTFDTWEGAEVIFTFGADSAGMWLFLLASIAVGVGVIAKMIMHENETFRSLDPHLVPDGAMRGANM